MYSLRLRSSQKKKEKKKRKEKERPVMYDTRSEISLSYLLSRVSGFYDVIMKGEFVAWEGH